jgi:hypothetical protein
MQAVVSLLLFTNTINNSVLKLFHEQTEFH